MYQFFHKCSMTCQNVLLEFPISGFPRIHSLQNFKNTSVKLIQASPIAQLSFIIESQLYDLINWLSLSVYAFL